MTMLLLLGLLSTFPCDEVTTEYTAWPASVDVLELMVCLDDLVAGNCPVADAGREQFATTGVSIQLDGSGSTGPDGVPDLTWVQIANGAPMVPITDPNSAMASIQPSLAGDYEFELIATRSCLSNRDTVRVRVSGQIDPPQALGFTLIADSNAIPGGPVPFTPAQVQAAPGQPDRQYILTLEGMVWIRDSGSILATPFIDVSSLISGCFECNLMSMAFHPDFDSNGMVYIKYVGTLLNGTGSDTDVRIAGFSPGMNPDVMSLGDGVDLLTIPQPTEIHAGGTIVFGKDGLLYIGTGDSGPQTDPNGNAQNTLLPLGKVLRYQVNGLGSFTIPDHNPFLDDANVLDQIYAIGLRNPWRVTVDRETGDLFIGDNGQDDIEELNMLSGEGVGGANLGWNTMEGTACFNPPMGCDSTGLQPPIWEYFHSDGGCSVIGGYVYRGNAIPALDGYFIYGDWCQGQLYVLRFEEGQWVNRGVTANGAPGLTSTQLVGFGEDLSGEVYMCTGGRVYQLTGASF